MKSISMIRMLSTPYILVQEGKQTSRYGLQRELEVRIYDSVLITINADPASTLLDRVNSRP